MYSSETLVRFDIDTQVFKQLYLSDYFFSDTLEIFIKASFYIKRVYELKLFDAIKYLPKL